MAKHKIKSNNLQVSTKKVNKHLAKHFNLEPSSRGALKYKHKKTSTKKKHLMRKYAQ